MKNICKLPCVFSVTIKLINQSVILLFIEFIPFCMMTKNNIQFETWKKTDCNNFSNVKSNGIIWWNGAAIVLHFAIFTTAECVEMSCCVAATFFLAFFPLALANRKKEKIPKQNPTNHCPAVRLITTFSFIYLIFFCFALKWQWTLKLIEHLYAIKMRSFLFAFALFSWAAKVFTFVEFIFAGFVRDLHTTRLLHIVHFLFRTQFLHFLRRSCIISKKK